MLLLPYDKIQIKSKHPAKIALDRLQRETTIPKGIFSDNVPGTIFRGKIQSNCFKIRRIISGRNSFLPVINGELLEDGSRSIINVTMRLSRDVMVFSLLIIISTVTAAAIDVYDTLHSVTGSTESFLHPAVFCILFYAVVLICYKIETRIATKHLLRIFD